jgi:hypothetical protein
MRVRPDPIFLFTSRSKPFPEKTLRVFFTKNGSQSQQPPAGAAAVVGGAGPCVQKWLTFRKRIAIFLQKTVCDFSEKIDRRFFFSDRDHDRD